ncbi:MAG TPA: hypothetical protein VIX11_10075 [Candidatus Acidoferrum sp.]
MRKRQREAGIALLISIFILLLISVVAIALVVSSGTESSLAGNYRSATGVYYAALSGLEEARGRLLSKNSDAFTTTNASGFLPATGIALNMGDTYYLINPVGGEAITPWDTSSTYGDNQFGVEFGPSGFGAPTNPSPTALSVWNRNPLLALNLPGPLYKWVRINAVSEKSAGIDADNDSLANNTVPLYYDGAHFSNNPLAGPQVLELTAFAVLPNGSQKIVQYLAAPTPLNLPNFPAAITLAGDSANTVPANSLSYSGPNSPSFNVDGTDSFRFPFGSCTATGNVYAGIGYTNTSDNSQTNIKSVQVVAHASDYKGTGAVTPNVLPVTMPPSLQTPNDYNNLVQTITKNADVIITPGSGTSPPYTSYATTDMTSLGMSPTNPLTVVVNGNLDFNGWHSPPGPGYGLLLVTGNLKYDPDASWFGIVMVIGKGTMTGSQNGGGEVDGATLVAQTVNPSTGASLTSLGPASITFSGTMTGAQGFYYSSCWIRNALPTASYKILSFHEITQ